MRITDELQKEIDTEWTWASHPMHWLDRDEIRDVSNEAQKIHDEIRHGCLTIHLHEEDHLRVVSNLYDNPTQAIVDFKCLYGTAVRTGPAPATATEQQAAQARATMTGELTITPHRRPSPHRSRRPSRSTPPTPATTKPCSEDDKRVFYCFGLARTCGLDGFRLVGEVRRVG
ncbi:hypothetical protein ACWGCW_36845, partial [Streptomyces sp. NPDC054933]